MLLYTLMSTCTNMHTRVSVGCMCKYTYIITPWTLANHPEPLGIPRHCPQQKYSAASQHTAPTLHSAHELCLLIRMHPLKLNWEPTFKYGKVCRQTSIPTLEIWEACLLPSWQQLVLAESWQPT